MECESGTHNSQEDEENEVSYGENEDEKIVEKVDSMPSV